MDSEKALYYLQSNGYKITKARKIIIEIIFNSQKPISAPQIQEKLIKKGIKVNKTTVYRELSFLFEKGIINQVSFSCDISFYESSYLDHHHHLVCDRCGKVEEVDCHKIMIHIKKFEKICLNKGFEIKKHSLEFFGYCSACR